MTLKNFMLWLKFTQTFLAFLIAFGCFLNFPNDALLSGLFWVMTTLLCVLGVVKHVLDR